MDKFMTMKKIVNLSVLVDILMIMLFSFIMTTNGEKRTRKTVPQR